MPPTTNEPAHSGVADMMAAAVSHFGNGLLGPAAAACEAVLTHDPGNPDALHMRGLVAHQLGDRETVIRDLKRAVQLRPDRADFLANLGVALHEQGRLEKAAEALRLALALNPDFEHGHYRLGVVLGELGRPELAAPHLERTVALNPAHAQAWNDLGVVHMYRRRFEDAIVSLRRAVELHPEYLHARMNLGAALNSAERTAEAVDTYRTVAKSANAGDEIRTAAEHMLASLTGVTTEAAPREYVRSLFDQYAAQFDGHLVEALEYRLPWQLREAIGRLIPADVRFANALDLGCGTGLAGDTFRDLAARLSGVDVSPKMVAEAEKKGVYDVLLVGELVAFLDRSAESFDLILAADLFPYVGDLRPVFARLARACAPGAYLAFTVESGDRDNFHLCDTGRYAHGSGYIEALAAEHGFSIASNESVHLRRDRGAWITGALYVLKPATVG